MPKPDSIPELSVVILCYKAGEAIRSLVADLVKQLHDNEIRDFELILVGNYLADSSDPTPAVVKSLSEQHAYIKAVIMVKQGMMGWDMRTGLAAAAGHHIAVIDGDGQMPMADVLRVYQAIKGHDYDLVKTHREIRGDGLSRRIISFGYNLIFNLLFPGLHTRDVNAKPKILTRQAYAQLDLQTNDWFTDAEIMIQARRLHFKIHEIPTRFLGLVGRRSFISWPAVFEFIKNLIIFRWREFKK